MKIFSVDLFQTIEDNPIVIYKIEALLKQQNNPNSPNSLVGFILEFEPFLKKTAQNIQMKKKYANIQKL